MENKKRLLKICLLGAESTGTTTLANSLASYYKTCWVPEFGRFYSEAKRYDLRSVDWKSEEFEYIADVQNKMQSYLEGIASNGILICDTDSWATRIWHERYMGYFSKKLDIISGKSKPDLYILTGDEIPFVQDGLRDGEHIRHAMHQKFVEELESQEVPFVILHGSKSKRLKEAINAIERIQEYGIK